MPRVPDSSQRRPLPWYLLPHWPWIVLAGIVLPYVILGIFQFSPELARWHAAAGREQQLDGNPQGALAHFDDAIARDAADPQFYRWRAECHRALQQYEAALVEYERLAAHQSLDTWDHFQRADLLITLGRHDQAGAAAQQGFDAFQQADTSPGEAHRAVVLNGVAYYHALTKTDLDGALIQVEAAVVALGGDAGILSDYASLCFLQGDHQEALKKLIAADRLLEARLETRSRQLEEEKGVVKRDDLKRRIQILNDERCRASYHRLLVFRKQLERLRRTGDGRQSPRQPVDDQLADLQAQVTAEQDRIENEFGSSLAEWERRPLPDKMTLIERMRWYAMVIDTRGFLHFQREEHAFAFRDLNLAVEIAEAMAEDWLLVQRGKSTDVRELERQRRSFCRSLAVIHYHRSLVAARLEKASMEQEDRGRVQELGHQPSAALF